jgi:hypothetical protein
MVVKKRKMTEDELASEIYDDISQCIPLSSEVSSERTKALEYYLAEPFGNEKDGRSQVITTDVADTVEGALPGLIKLFTSSDDVALFDPVGPEDEEQARQESDYINHVFYKDNDGFLILYTWFKDALLSKNGVVKYYWCDESEEKHESYESLSPEQVQMLLADDNIEVTGQEVVLDEMGSPRFSVNITRKESKGKLEVICIPPEKFHVSPAHNSILLCDVPFCAHEEQKYKWELEEEGYDADKIEEAFDDYVMSQEEQGRFADVMPVPYDEEKITVYECYKRVDWDNDGYPELRKITLVGQKTILDNVEIDYLPFESITPIPMTHRFVGRSYADITMDLQLIRSTLLRNIFDNLYLTNNMRTGVVDGEVNIDDLLDSRPGGVVRMTAPNMVFPIQVAQFPAAAYQMMEYLDQMRENRTGITRYNQGMDANALNKTATGINKIMDASQERLLLVAKLFADGLRRLFLGMHRLILQHQDFKRVVRLRNKWVPVDPSEWKNRENMTINVALGTNNKEDQVQALMLIGQIQKEMMGAGKSNMVDDTLLYNTAKKLVEATGFRHAEYFFKDPATQPPPQPPPPPPEIMVQQMIAQAELEKAKAQQQEVALKGQIAQQDFQIELKKLELEAAKIRLEAEKAGLKGLQDNKKIEYNKEIQDKKVVLEVAKASADTVQKVEDRRERSRSEQTKQNYDIIKATMDQNMRQNKNAVDKGKT